MADSIPLYAVFTVPWLRVFVVIVMGVVGLPPPPPLQPITKAQIANPHMTLNECNLIIAPADPEGIRFPSRLENAGQPVGPGVFSLPVERKRIRNGIIKNWKI